MATFPSIVVSSPNGMNQRGKIRRRSAPDCSPVICCLPLFRKQLKQSAGSMKESVSTNSSPVSLEKLENVIDNKNKGRSRRLSSDWPDKASNFEFHSCVSSMSYLDELAEIPMVRAQSATAQTSEVDDVQTAGRDWRANETLPIYRRDWPRCLCGFTVHMFEFSPEMPLFTPPNMVPDSYEEKLFHSKAILGHWITILDRSDSLDPQMVHLGIGKIKRGVMNRLQVPFSAEMEDNDKVLHCQIYTPLGPKHMHASLEGKEMFDDDSDCGQWSGVAKMVDFPIPWFCDGRPVRAFQLKRNNKKFGECFETRVVLPDKEEGKILLFNLHLFPLEADKAPIRVDRILKFVRPLD